MCCNSPRRNIEFAVAVEISCHQFRHINAAGVEKLPGGIESAIPVPQARRHPNSCLVRTPSRHICQV